MNPRNQIKLAAFDGDEHLPFAIAGEQSVAVILVHGFPGTPAEMRPLASQLNALGASVMAPLLPGFGPQIETLSARTRYEWIETIKSSLVSLRQTHRRVVLAGFSMGGALSIIASEGPAAPDHLILLAPFWRLGQPWLQPFWPLVRLFIPQFKPFAKADFADPEVRRDLYRSMPDANLDLPEIQDAIRQISFPFSVIDEIIRTGQMAWQSAPLLSMPLTIIQGTSDRIVPLAATRKLTGRFSAPAGLIEVDSGHQLMDPDSLVWDTIIQQIVNCVFLNPDAASSSYLTP